MKTQHDKEASADSRLHGNVLDRCSVALLLIDVINDLDFPEGRDIFEAALEMSGRIAELRAKARAVGIPTIYVNDNFGRWRSDFRVTVAHCLRKGVLGRPIVERLKPIDEDYFVLKPKHSGFFSTTLEILLRALEVRTVILTGIAGNNCVLFTANDAYLHDYQIIVPADCIASNTPEDNRFALKQMQQILKADIRPSSDLDLRQLIAHDTPS